MNLTKNRIKPKLYRNPTKYLTEPSIHEHH